MALCGHNHPCQRWCLLGLPHFWLRLHLRLRARLFLWETLVCSLTAPRSSKRCHSIMGLKISLSFWFGPFFSVSQFRIGFVATLMPAHFAPSHPRRRFISARLNARQRHGPKYIMIPSSITLHQMRYTTMHGGNKYYFLIKLLLHPRPRMLLLSFKSQTRRTRTSLSTTASQKNMSYIGCTICFWAVAVKPGKCAD